MGKRILSPAKFLSVFVIQIGIFLGCSVEKTTITILTGPSMSFLAPTKVIITWETDTPGNSVVEYGLTKDLDSLLIDDEERQLHAVTLSNLAFNSTYYYRVSSTSLSFDTKVFSDIDSFSTGMSEISIVTGPLVELISPTEVIISWDTDTSGNSIVEYGLTSDLDSLYTDDEEVKFHSVSLSSLVPDTIYYYKVISISSSLNAQVSSEIENFTTIQGEINIISPPSVQHISPTEVLITWDTDVPGNSIVDYGTTSDLDSQIVVLEEELSHNISVSNLAPGTIYYYRVTSISSSLNAQISSEIDTFTTREGEINIISLLLVEHISPTEVFITWDTDVPANSIVDYGTSIELGSQVIDSQEQLSHSVSLMGLTPATMYYYRVTSISSALNAQVSSEIDTFTTSEGEINIISLPFIDHISPTEVLITWDTDVPGNSIVDYGTSTELGSQVMDSQEQLSHSVTLTELTTATTYYYQVTSISSALGAQVTSEIDTFTTSPGEINIVMGPSVNLISSTDVLITWDTDVPGTSIVDYGITTTLDSQVVDIEEQLSHDVTLMNLKSNTTYYYQVTSISSSLNAQVSSEIDTFSTSGSRLR